MMEPVPIIQFICRQTRNPTMAKVYGIHEIELHPGEGDNFTDYVVVE